MIKSLQRRNHDLSDPKNQLLFFENGVFSKGNLPTFREKLKQHNREGIQSGNLEILQLNLGYMCNQTCKHCHVDAGPDRKEIMSMETFNACLGFIKANGIRRVDLTGGAPEMNPHFEEMLDSLISCQLDELIVRSNLTILVSHNNYSHLPRKFSNAGVRIVSSLPFYSAEKTDSQRGKGVFGKSIEALKILNAEGFGREKTKILDLVYNPAGAFLPADQIVLEKQFKEKLLNDFDVHFTNLLALTNLPISRFLDYLVESENYDDYMETLVQSFNPATIDGLMCKNTLSVDWNGGLFDCDFNQMLKLQIQGNATINNINIEELKGREILLHQHCYGCTAGSGSSCQGTVI